jgi:hypothetical protein
MHLLFPNFKTKAYTSETIKIPRVGTPVWINDTCHRTRLLSVIYLVSWQIKLCSELSRAIHETKTVAKREINILKHKYDVHKFPVF